MGNKIIWAFFIMLSLGASSCSKNSDSTPQPTNPASTAPTIVSYTTASITINSAVCNASISADGGSAITERGICYNLTGNPTIADTKIACGSGTGDYSASLTGLTDNTIYHYRAYCINTNGTYYSGDATFHTLRIFTLGESYGGGIIFYIDNTAQHGLIAAPANSAAYNSRWGCIANIPNAMDTVIGSGIQNTNAIMGLCNVPESAVGICFNLTLDGYNAWFLPSKHELDLMYDNRALIGDFQSDTYWSSSQYNGPWAWSKNFSTGQSAISDKGVFYRFRPIRAF